MLRTRFRPQSFLWPSVTSKRRTLCSLLFVFFLQRGKTNQLRALQRILHRGTQKEIAGLGVRKTHFPLGRMHIHIDCLRIRLKKEYRKREVMLHHAVAVAVLYRLCEQRTLDIAPVHAVVFEGSASP